MTTPKNPKRILVVEDDPNQRETYAALAYYNGFDVDEAASLWATITYLENEKPDAILLDVMLPDANSPTLYHNSGCRLS